jgi:hypothetical protein
VKSKDREALTKMYAVDKETMAEITKAMAEVEIAKANAIVAAAQQPENAGAAGCRPGARCGARGHERQDRAARAVRAQRSSRSSTTSKFGPDAQQQATRSPQA